MKDYLRQQIEALMGDIQEDAWRKGADWSEAEREDLREVGGEVAHRLEEVTGDFACTIYSAQLYDMDDPQVHRVGSLVGEMVGLCKLARQFFSDDADLMALLDRATEYAWEVC